MAWFVYPVLRRSASPAADSGPPAQPSAPLTLPSDDRSHIGDVGPKPARDLDATRSPHRSDPRNDDLAPSPTPAPTIMIAATIQVRRAYAPLFIGEPAEHDAPRKVGASIVLFSRAGLPGLRCHSLATSVDAIPHIDRS